jgi:DNA-binding transcriptional LysR family regulator
MISLRGLECLVTTAEQGSLTKAAAVLHISQPALSHQIAAIERELGTAVLERLPRGIRPTAAGLAAVAEARVALAAAGQVVTAARPAAAGAGGRIRIACPETMAGWLLVPVMRDWQRRFPQVELALNEYAAPGGMLEAAGEADICVTTGVTTGAHTEVLGEEEIVVVASPGHRFAAMDSVPPEELSGEPLVRYDPDDGSAPWLDEFAARGAGHDAGRGAAPPRPAPRAGSPRTAAYLAASGMGVAIVPVSALTPRPDGTIRSLDPPQLRDIVVIVSAPHDALVRRFVRDLRQRCRPGGAARVSRLRPHELMPHEVVPHEVVPHGLMTMPGAPDAAALRPGQSAYPHRVDAADGPYPGDDREHAVAAAAAHDGPHIGHVQAALA